MPNLNAAHEYPGFLICVEGIDGSGKSTQARLLQSWLERRGEGVFFTEWNSSPLVKKATRAGKKRGDLTPLTFSLLHATDFADRHIYQIVPPLKAGMIVVADRYAYTAFARDAARGLNPRWLRDVYAFAPRPDVAIYFKVPVELGLERIRLARARIKYYEAGMDMSLSPDLYESFLLFQSRVVEEYDRLVEEFGLTVVDATRPIAEQQREVRDIVTRAHGRYRKERGATWVV